MAEHLVEHMAQGRLMPGDACTITATRDDPPRRWSNEEPNVARIVSRQDEGEGKGSGGPEDRPYRLLVIDPKPFTRNCLVAAIEGARDIGSVQAAQDAGEAQALIDAGPGFDAMILNLDQDAGDEHHFSSAVAPLQASLPGIPLLLIGPRMTQAFLNAALDHGVRGVLAMDTALSVTLDAIRFVCRGWMIYPAFQRQRGAGMALSPPTGIAMRLTPRQEEVLQCLATGMPNKEIAYQLHMSESTVKAHIKEIMQRLGAINRTQVVALLNGQNGSGGGNFGN